MTPAIELADVTADNWRACADLEVTEHRGRGYGRAAVLALLERLRREQGCSSAALSYAPANTPARALYLSLGFVETGEREDDELVARLRFAED